MEELYLIGMLFLLAPIVIIILLAITMSRTSNLRRNVERLENEIAHLKRAIVTLRTQEQPIAEDTATQDIAPPAKADVNAPQEAPETPPATMIQAQPAQPAQPKTTDTVAAYRRGGNADELRQAARAQEVASAPIAPEPPTEDDAAEQESGGLFKGLSLEDVIGGKLPIWIGGIALIFAAFFLVRYSIEAGLFGPRARSITAAIFGLATIAMSEFGTRLPRIGFAFAEDKRIGQSLAGAGIAILYATLYMASELYGLLPLIAAFALVVLISALAFMLALRHGPPTAIMGVVGGFTAPFIAGLDAGNLPLLLSYLGVFIIALCALSIWQRWLWLLFMAVIGGGIWTITLVSTALNQLPILGVFIIAAAMMGIGAALRFEEEEEAEEEQAVTQAVKQSWVAGFGNRQIAIGLPQILALLQLCILVPRMEFSPLGWAFLFAISGLSLALAWRYGRLIMLAGLTATGFIFPLAAGWISGTQADMMLGVSFGYAALFAGTALTRLHKYGPLQDKAAGWAFLTLMPILVAYSFIIFQYQGPLSAVGIGFVGLIMALPCLWTAWMLRGNSQIDAYIQTAIAAICNLMLGGAMVMILPGDYLALIGVVLALGVSAWAGFTNISLVRIWGYVPLAASILAMLISAEAVVGQLLGTFAGAYMQHDLLPAPSELIINVILPAALLAIAAFVPNPYWSRSARTVFALSGSAFLGIYLALLSKQPLAITTLDDFTLSGFTERTITTLLIAGAGAAMLRFARGTLQAGGIILIIITMIRFIWFDMLVFNPLLREQAVGALPVFNLAILLCAALTGIFWWSSKQRAALEDYPALEYLWNNRLPSIFYSSALVMAVITTLVLVRQYMHGTIIASAPIGTTENYLYSAALLLLALAWIGYAIMRGGRTLRLAGLGLLTLVTLKVFLVDAAALQGLLRILSFLGLGIALIVIGWAYRRLLLRTPKGE